MANLVVLAVILVIKVAIVAVTTVAVAAEAVSAAALFTAEFLGGIVTGLEAVAGPAAAGAAPGAGATVVAPPIVVPSGGFFASLAVPEVAVSVSTVTEAATATQTGGFLASIQGGFTAATEAYSGLSLGQRAALSAASSGIQAGFGALKDRQETQAAIDQAKVNRDFNNGQLDLRLDEETIAASEQLQKANLSALRTRGVLAVTVQARGLSITELLNDALAEAGREGDVIQQNLDFKARQTAAEKTANNARVAAIRFPSTLATSLRIGGAALRGATTSFLTASIQTSDAFKRGQASVSGVS